jgi:hypothetical protein
MSKSLLERGSEGWEGLILVVFGVGEPEEKWLLHRKRNHIWRVGTEAGLSWGSMGGVTLDI